LLAVEHHEDFSARLDRSATAGRVARGLVVGGRISIPAAEETFHQIVTTL